MSQIGIAIKPTISGNHHPIAINEGEWTRRIRDMRPALLHYPAMQKDHKLIASMIFFDEKGCYIVISRTVTNNDLENVSGWIHIPYNMQISTAELEEVIHLMRQIVEKPELPPRQYLQQTFGAKQYPDKHDAQPFEPSQRNAIFAKRVQGKNQSLASLLGENLFLPSYAKYETILVEEFPGEVADAVDITQVCSNEQSQIEAEIRRRARAAQGRGNRRVNPQQGNNEKTQVFNPDERTRTTGRTNGFPNQREEQRHGFPNQREEQRRSFPNKREEQRQGFPKQREEQRQVFPNNREKGRPGLPNPQSTTGPMQEQFGVPEPPKPNMFKTYGIAFIVGLAVGILIGILIMAFRNSSNENGSDAVGDSASAVEVVDITTAPDSASVEGATAVQDTTTVPELQPVVSSPRHKSRRKSGRRADASRPGEFRYETSALA